jgi:diacylglycerol O-acyltransferase
MAVAHPGVEKLSGLDRTFLALERGHAHMHVGAVLLFEPGSLVDDADGRADIERVAAYTAARLHLLPRYRQRLAEAPVSSDLFWVDDLDFDLRRHLHHVRVPGPGDPAALRGLVSELMERPLRHDRPLWELWLCDGLAEGGFALVIKVHHCLSDGVAAVDLLAALLGPDPISGVPDAPDYRPRLADPLRVVARDVARVATRPLRFARALRRALEERETLGEELRDRIDAVGEALGSYRHVSDTPLNRRIGSERRVEWLEMPLSELRRVREALGGTINDAVLAIVTGALREFLLERGVAVGRLDMRALVPVSMRGSGDSQPGNRIALWLVDLPVEEPDARLRHEQIRSVTDEHRRAGTAQGAAALARVTDWTPTALLSSAARMIPLARPFNLLVSNVPGPQVPLYLLDARLRAGFPLAPLFLDQGLAVALISYDARVCWGLVSDPRIVPDLDVFARRIETALSDLLERT